MIRPPTKGSRRVLRPWGQHTSRRPPGRPARQSHAWFWKLIDADIAAASPGRWQNGLDTLRSNRGKHGPLVRADSLMRIAGAWQDQIRAAARRHDISEALILAVIAVESAGKPRARSPKGAQGLMQLIPATAARFGVADAYDPAQNLTGGTAYLDFLLKMFEGDVILALAGYNAGENAVIRHRGVPPYAETRDYVVKVLDAIVSAEQLCAAPPTGPRRACLFRLTPPAGVGAGPGTPPA